MTGLNLIVMALFTGISLLLVAACPKKYRWGALLATSLLCYTFLLGSKMLVILALAILIYIFSYVIERNPKHTWLCISFLLVPLILAKAFHSGNHLDNYISERVASIERWHWFSVLQLVGLSYFTFNGISYLIDVKRKITPREENFLHLLLYLVFFPTVLSGPLHRYNFLSAQFKHIEITEDSVSNGCRLILWGLFKTCVLAQRLYQMVNSLYFSEISGVYYLLLGLFFFFYLYFVFSSFIDIVQGIAQLYGIQVKGNFVNRVYWASCRQEFWKGWHITLNEWFRDYFFFVLSRYDKKRRYTNALLLVTFVLIALWHEVTFVMLLWGMLNGFWIVIEKRVNLRTWPYPKLRTYLGPVYHLSVASAMALVFIAPDITFLFTKVILNAPLLPGIIFTIQYKNILILILAFLIVDYIYAQAGKRRIDAYFAALPSGARWVTYFILGFLILAFGLGPQVNNYYLQF